MFIIDVVIITLGVLVFLEVRRSSKKFNQKAEELEDLINQGLEGVSNGSENR